MNLHRIAVVGASLAGVRACGGLRAAGFTGEICLIGAESHPPYDRPPLSKKVLSGDWGPERITLFREGEVERLSIEQRYGVAAVGLDLAPTRRVLLADGTAVSCDGVIIATGAGLRRLPDQPQHPDVVELRTLDDSLALRERLAGGGAHVVIVGAGFIGLEVAATARSLGNEVTVLEGAPAPLIRGLGAEMGRAVTAVHADHGVPIHCGVQVRGLTPRAAGGVDVAVQWSDGSAATMTASIVVVGIGVAPNTAWLDDSGIALRDGVVCDATLNATNRDGSPIAGVFAAGDVARWPNGQFGGEEMRVEHWTNASEQADHAAKALLTAASGAAASTFVTVPFFWSDQYDRRIQFLGRAAGDDEVRIVAGSVEDRRFLALYGKGGRLRAALGLSMPKPLMRCRALLLDGAGFDDATDAVASWD